MALTIRDCIRIPPAKPSLVVRVGEINSAERGAFYAREYVLTPTVARGLSMLTHAVAESADKGFPGQGIWVAGSFGTGKSHFLSYAGMLLRGEAAAWGRDIPGLDRALRQAFEGCRVLVVPFSALERPDDLRLGLYQAVNRELVRVGIPPVALTYYERILAWFEKLTVDVPTLWQILYDRSLVVGSNQEREALKATPEGRETLAREVAAHISLPVELAGTAYALEMGEGVGRITAHLRAHGYAAAVFLVDDLTLLLANSQDKVRPLVDLSALLEGEGAKLPVWALVSRHAPLGDVAPDTAQEILDNLKERLAQTVDLQDADIYEVLGQRVLKHVPEREGELEQALADSLGQLPPEQLQALQNLYGQKEFAQALRARYPFHPAMVDTLVSVIHLLSRERTAISVMYDMLLDLAERPLGTLPSYHELFPYLVEGIPESELQERPQLLAAQGILRDKVRPLQEERTVGQPEKVGRAEVVARSVVLGQLTEGRVDLRGRMTLPLIAALNAGASELAQRPLEETVEFLCNQLLGTFRREGEALVVDLSLGLDPLKELLAAEVPDLSEQRHTLQFAACHELFATEAVSGRRTLTLKWRGTTRQGTVQVVEGSANALPAADPSAEFAVWLALPSSLASGASGGSRPPDPPLSSIPGALWLPQEDHGGLQQLAERLARILYLTETPGGKAYCAEHYGVEEAKHLDTSWQTMARQLRGMLRARWQELYLQGGVSSGLSSVGAQVSVAGALEDSLYDLAARLLDGRFGQHPEFAFEVTPQALASLYRAFLRGEGKIGLEAGAPFSYAAAFGLPLGVCRIVGTAYALDLDNSPYIQALEKQITAPGARLSELQQHMAEVYGLLPWVTTSLARMVVIFRERRVVRANKPLAIGDPNLFDLQSGDLLTPSQRVEHSEWAAFSHYLRALGAGELPTEPNVHRQDEAWSALQRWCEERSLAMQALRRAAAEAAKVVGGMPVELEKGIVELSETFERLSDLFPLPSEEGIRALAAWPLPAQTIPARLESALQMTTRLSNAPLRNLYGHLALTEGHVQAGKAVQEYAAGHRTYEEAVTIMQSLLIMVPPRPESPSPKPAYLTLTVPWGPLRAWLLESGRAPAGSRVQMAYLPDDATATVEVRDED